MKRVYFDTNVFGGFLPDNPGTLKDFARLSGNGFRYYSSIDVFGELAANRDKEKFIEQFGYVSKLIPAENYYRQPKDLVHCDVGRFLGKVPVSLLAPRDSVLRAQELVQKVYLDEDMKKARAQHIDGYRDFMRSEKEALETVFREIQEPERIPRDFEVYWNSLRSRDLLRSSLEELLRPLPTKIPSSAIPRLLQDLAAYKAIFMGLIILKLHPFTRVLEICPARRGDKGDLRHSIIGAYNDIFVSRDQPFRNFLSVARPLLPFEVISPEEFLARA